MLELVEGILTRREVDLDMVQELQQVLLKGEVGTQVSIQA